MQLHDRKILCPDCGEDTIANREIDGVHDFRCEDCGAVFGEGNLPLAERVYTCGRAFLRIGGLYMAMEGDTIRDPEFEGRTWTPETILKAVKAINQVHRERAD